MWAGSMNTGPFAMFMARRRSSTARIGCGIRALSPTERDGISTCRTAGRVRIPGGRSCAPAPTAGGHGRAPGSLFLRAFDPARGHARRGADLHAADARLSHARKVSGVRRPEDIGAWTGDVEVPGGRWRLGSTSADGFVFDNEKWAHDIDIAPFRISKAPVTNAEFAAFVESGGYRNREFWSAAGWAWREQRRLPNGRSTGARTRAAAGAGFATARSSS